MAKKLKAPKGTDEANIGGQSFRVDNDHTITLPDDVDASPLLDRGGFVTVVDPVEIPHGLALVAHADPNAELSLGERSGAGFLIPVDQVAAVAAHGFVAVDPASSSPVAATAIEAATDEPEPAPAISNPDAPVASEPA